MNHMPTYSFDTEIATKYGLPEAVVLWNLMFWIRKNRANGTNIHEVCIDGENVQRTWTYNSISAFEELFPWWSADQIRRILKRLVNDGVIIEGNYNKMRMDRTKWYAFRDEESMINSHLAKSPDGLAKTTNGTGENHKPIPDNKPDSKQHIDICTSDTSTDSLKTRQSVIPSLGALAEAQFESCWKMFGRCGAKKVALRYWRRLSQKQRDEIQVAIPKYMRVVKAGRRQKNFQGWINPSNCLWEEDWDRALAEWTKDEKKGVAQRQYTEIT